MGRPINKKYFGNRNPGGIGGEGIATIAIANSGTLYSGVATATVQAPELPGGVQATIGITASGGNITSVTLTNPGSGYTAVPTVTFTPATTGTTATFVITLTDVREQGITGHAWVPGAGGSSVADINKQVSSTRYRVTTAAGTGVCKLVAAVPAAEGEMNILATDSVGGTYYVTKLTSRRATIVRDTGTQFLDNSTVGWNLTAAVVNSSVVIENE